MENNLSRIQPMERDNCNPRKISFILCTNHETYYRECCLYLEQLSVPDGFTVEIIPVFQAASMASGYQSAMVQSDAKYKVYLHQDVFILHRDFLVDALAIFTHNPKIGMLGMVGTKRLPDNGCMWSSPMRTGALRSCSLNTADDFFDIPAPGGRSFTPVQAVDGLLMMTSRDIPWRQELFDGWDFYDVSQSLEFTRQKLWVVVPCQETPWVLHDCGFMNLSHYHQYRGIFLREYFPTHLREIEDCDEKISRSEQPNQKHSHQEQIVSKITSLLDEGRFPVAWDTVREHLPACQENETFCIYAILLQIYQEECALGKPEIFTFLSSHPAGELPEHFLKIKLYLWRREYQLPQKYQQEGNDYFKRYHVSKTALSHIRKLCRPIK